MKNKFPNNFLWGGSIAAHQCEGAYNLDGKGLAIMDFVTKGGVDQPRIIHKEIEENTIYPSHDAIDFYHKYKDDIHMLEEMNTNALRISIDWSRIFPNGDDLEPNEKGIQFYENVVDCLLEHHIEPIITLCHFEMPVQIVKKYDSWLNRETIDLYLKYCSVMMNRLKGKVHRWVTFNEMNHLERTSNKSSIFTYLISGFLYDELDGYKGNSIQQNLAIIGYHMVLACVKAVQLGHQIDSENKVGCVFGLTPYYPNSCRPEDVLQAFKDTERDLYQIDAICNGKFPSYKLCDYENRNIKLNINDEDKQDFQNGCIDFIGLNYYSTEVSSAYPTAQEEISLFGGLPNKYLEKSAWGWSIDPIGLRYQLNYIYHRYHKPIIITENGLGAIDKLENNTVIDDYRIEYLKKHLCQLKKAINEDGVDCFGYLMWAPIDLISATTGEMKKRYGFIYVDKNDDGTGTLKRYKKESFYWYKNLIETQGQDI